MKSIKLNIEDSVFFDFEAAIRTKRLDGKFGGVPDMVSLAILEAIKMNQVERTLRYRRNAPIINAVGR